MQAEGSPGALSLGFEEIVEIVRGIPHATPRQGRVLHDIVARNGYRRCLELGFAHGVGSTYIASALSGDGTLVSVDLPNSVNRRPPADETVARAGLAGRVTFVRHEMGYNWFLMEAIERGVRFDFCFLDGAHTWDVDALAFLLLDRVLAPGGTVVFDDLDWTIARSPTLRTRTDFAEPARQLAGVRKVVELLVKRTAGYSWLGEVQGMGIARKDD